MINWIKDWFAERKLRKQMKKKLKELKDKDPFIYE